MRKKLASRASKWAGPDAASTLTPEDDAAYYAQFATALHAVDPALKLGGPVFESNAQDVKAWPDANGETSWTKRYLAYLSSHGHLQDLSSSTLSIIRSRPAETPRRRPICCANPVWCHTFRQRMAQRWAAAGHADLHYRDQLFAK